MTGYPHHLAGDEAPAPRQPPDRVLAMAAKAHGKHLAAVDHELFTAAPWRLAGALEVLRGEANTAAPNRGKRSDGTIGDARHQAENGPHGPGSGSDHNPWLIVAGRGVVRALDLTNDPALDLPTAFERLRRLAAAGRLPQVTGGGYAILLGRITAPDWSGWRHYTGPDPHAAHGHVSASLDPAGFDSTAPWGLFIPEQATPAPAPPAPVPAPGPGWTGPDLTGVGPGLRGNVGDNGPRVAAWQAWLQANYPAYARDLAPDGWWGPRTTAVNAEFGHRSGIPSADGRNIGPKLAAAYAAAGLFRPLGAPDPDPVEEPAPEPAPPAPPPAGKVSARDRVRSHIARGTRR